MTTEKLHASLFSIANENSKKVDNSKKPGVIASVFADFNSLTFIFPRNFSLFSICCVVSVFERVAYLIVVHRFAHDDKSRKPDNSRWKTDGASPALFEPTPISDQPERPRIDWAPDQQPSFAILRHSKAGPRIPNTARTAATIVFAVLPNFVVKYASFFLFIL